MTEASTPPLSRRTGLSHPAPLPLHTWACGLVLALLPIAPQVLSGLVVIDWTDTVEVGVVGWMEAVAVLLWATSRHALASATVRWLPPLLAAWLAAMVVTSIAATDGAMALVRTTEWIGHLAFGTVVWTDARRDARTWRVIGGGAGVGFLVVVLTALGTGMSVDGPAVAYNWASAFPLLHGVRCLGFYALVGIAVGMWPWLGGSTSRWTKAGGLVVQTIGWSALWWSASRASCLGALVGSAYLIWMLEGKRWQTAGMLVGVAMLGAMVSLAVPADPEYAGMWRLFAGPPEGTGVAGFSSGRTDLWVAVWEAWQHSPWVGQGPGSPAWLLLPLGFVHAHNALLHALAEWGVLGTLPFVAITLGLIGRAVQERHEARTPAALVAAAYALAAGATSMLDGLLNDPATTALMVVAAAAVLQPRASKPSAVQPASVLLSRGVAGAGVWTGVVMTAHLVALAALWAPGVPAPESVRARYVLAASAHPDAKIVEGWARAWMHSAPSDADRVVAWGLSRGGSPWLFLRLRADLALSRGDTVRAEADFRRAAVLYQQATEPMQRYKERGAGH